MDGRLSTCVEVGSIPIGGARRPSKSSLRCLRILTNAVPEGSAQHPERPRSPTRQRQLVQNQLSEGSNPSVGTSARVAQMAEAPGPNPVQ